MSPIAPAMTPPRPPTYITVMLDGKLIGHVRSLAAPALVSRLRDIKAAKLAEEESPPVGASTIMLDVSHTFFIETKDIWELDNPKGSLWDSKQLGAIVLLVCLYDSGMGLPSACKVVPPFGLCL